MHAMTRRKFIGAILAGGVSVVAGGLQKVVTAAATTSKGMSMSKSEQTFLLGGDLSVNRLGFGAMRITGEGIWGWPPDRENAVGAFVRFPAQNFIAADSESIEKTIFFSGSFLYEPRKASLDRL